MPKKSTIPVAILVRVSTSKQETNRQVNEATQYAQSKGYLIVEVCKETVSGSAGDDEREGLRRVEELAEAGQIQKVLVHEISRLARRNSVAHKFVETLEHYGVSLYWHAQGIETLLPSGKRNPAAGIMLALLAEMARNEVEVLKVRIVSGLAEARRRGTALGRRSGPVGWTKFYREKNRGMQRVPSDVRFHSLPKADQVRFAERAQQEFLQKHRDVLRLLKEGQSVRNAAKIAGKSASTVQRVKALVR